MQPYTTEKRESAMYHNTLNEALLAGNVDLALWPVGCNIGYNESARVVSSGVFITVSRDSNGLYETAISYFSQCDDMARIVPYC